MNFDFEVGERAGTDLPDPPSTIPPGSTQFAAATSPASPPTLDDTQQARRGTEEDRLARFWEPCPQGEDCAGDGKHRRLFDCEQGCGFRGCSACMEVHESEPHASEAETTLEMFRDIGLGLGS